MVSGLKRSIGRLAYRRPEAAEVLGVSETKFREWEARGLVPKPVRVDGVILYDAAELQMAWDALRSGSPRRGHKEPNPYDT